jgi:cytochrome c556
MTTSRTVLLATLAVAAFAVSAASAGPMEDRQAAMKAVGQAMKEGAGINSPATFDAAKAKSLMDGIAANAKKLKGLYPAGSGADPKSSADPKIWQNKADFDKRLSEMAAAATAAGKATTAETFKPAYVAVGATCKSCHDIYRKKKS